MSEKEKWMEDSEVLSIFPTCVWKIQLTPGFRQRINSKILQIISQINPDLAEIPPGESWQSGQNLHNRDQLVDLISCIQNTAQTVLRFLKVGYNAIEITGCWANINASGAAHVIHSHPNNFLSGIYSASSGHAKKPSSANPRALAQPDFFCLAVNQTTSAMNANPKTRKGKNSFTRIIYQKDDGAGCAGTVSACRKAFGLLYNSPITRGGQST